MYKALQLADIQKMQFSHKEQAEKELLAFLKENEDISIEKIELLPKPESLNSVNGFITYTNNERYFFKSHVEENEQISEYYNASILAQAGYPVLSTKQIAHKPGQQIVLYEIVSLPTLFDLTKVEEDKEMKENAESKFSQPLITAQIELDKIVASIYQNTCEQLAAEDHIKAPINQLFSHRLADAGRLGLFYRDKSLHLQSGTLTFDKLANMQWIINGVAYAETLEQIIEQSKALLCAKAGPAIVGHGDAHNGNIFIDQKTNKLVMFDPAFAGRHHPLLDITKPLFHNVFARWMYYPEQVENEITLFCKVIDNHIIIEHSYAPSALRCQFLQSKKENVLIPTLEFLHKKNLLANNWSSYLRAALFCCPFLTVNLLAPHSANGTLAERYNLPIKLLGLAMAVEFGANTHAGSSPLSDLIDNLLA